MRRHVLPNLDDLDLSARELATAAACRAGLSLEDWAAQVLTGQNPEFPPPQPRRSGAGDIDAILARLSPAGDPQPSRDYKRLMAAAEAESERAARDRAARNAIALESMATWIEQTEERLNQSARASAAHQDQLASALSQALAALKDRLDSVEQQVVRERAAPARIEFPVQEAAKALAPLSETLVGLRTDVSRLGERLDKAQSGWAPAVSEIRADIEQIRSGMGNLATQDEVSALGQALKDIARSLVKELEQGKPGKDLLTLAHSIAALHRQVQNLSDEMADGMHRRFGGEIELIGHKIDRMAETGVDRSVIDFLSSQIVDLRQDLAHRAEPEQIERLSDDVASLGRQLADLRINQVGRSDFASLKTSLENVCAALARTAAAPETSAVPGQLESLSERLDELMSRPEPTPPSLDPVTEQLAQITQRMEGFAEVRQQGDALEGMIGRLTSEVQTLAGREPPSQEALLQRFDQLEQDLRVVGQQADTSTVELMLRAIDEKLERAPERSLAFDALEQKIAGLADRLAQTPDGALQKAIDEASAHLKSLHDDAAAIAERAAKAALNDLRPSLPDPSDLDALKQGFVELKALQTRADGKTQQTLRAVHEALETLLARIPQQPAPAMVAEPRAAEATALPPAKLAPADRLEAAVRRLHAAALSQMEEVSAAQASSNEEPAAAPEASLPVAEPAPARAGMAASLSVESGDLGAMRAGFIAAARRAAQTNAPDKAALSEDPVAPASETEATAQPSLEEPPTPPSLIARLRRTFESQRRSLLLGLAVLVLAGGAVEILSSGADAGAKPEGPRIAQATEDRPQTTKAAAAAPQDRGASTTTLAAAAPERELTAAGKFLVDPGTVGALPSDLPSSLRQAGLQGDAAALYEVALRAAEGRGLAQDMALAVRLYERAAQAGLPPAQERLAMLHEKGIGVARDPKLAAIWYERAAQGGNVRAMHNLATLLASGLNGKPDYATALRWYGEAAESGLRDSQYNMGVLLARGIGAKQDNATAFKWFSLAAAQGDADAAKKRDELAGRLAPVDLAAARSALEQWRPRAVDPIANETAPLPAGQTANLAYPIGNKS